jgi:predicted nucleic acid-binding protein
MPYLDTSILGSYYCPESLSAMVNRAMVSIDEAVISPLVDLEFHSLLAMKVRSRNLERQAANSALAQFHLHLIEQFYQFVDIGSVEFELARGWLGKFTTSLRTLDALHLAAAKSNDLDLFTTDKILAASASHFGVSCQLLKA